MPDLRGQANRLACCLAVALLATNGLPVAVAASVDSDRMIVIERDGRTHVVQHVIATDGPLVTLDLPGSVIPQHTRFLGPERKLFASAHRRLPSRLSIWSGSAFARYRHQYGDEIELRADGKFILTADALPASLDVERNELDEPPSIESVTTWVFPGGVEVDSWRRLDAMTSGASSISVDPGTDGGPDDGGIADDVVADTVANTVADAVADRVAETGANAGGDVEAGMDASEGWTFEDNILAFSHTGSRPVELEIVFHLSPADAEPADADADAISEAPKPDDFDEDGVPDDRDLCVSGVDTTTSRPPAREAIPGCTASDRLILGAIRFDSGKSYLELDARRLLDRVAAGLQPLTGSRWEIAAFTDDDGSAARNLALSQRRADAVRQYLLLRGLAPNRLRAEGYGEADPIADNSTADGRLLNRRIELRRLDR